MAKQKTETQQTKDLRAKKCFDDIAKVLKKYNCEIEPIGTIRNKSIELGLNIIAK